MARSTALVRPRRGRVIAGVCPALARRFDVEPWQVRLLFVLSCLLPGPQVLLYVALWIILPAEWASGPSFPAWAGDPRERRVAIARRSATDVQ